MGAHGTRYNLQSNKKENLKQLKKICKMLKFNFPEANSFIFNCQLSGHGQLFDEYCCGGMILGFVVLLCLLCPVNERINL